VRDNKNPTIFKAKFQYWEAERLSDGTWALMDPCPLSTRCIIVADDWFRANFEPINGPKTYHRSNEKYGPFVEN